jgi:ATP-binding protein involved in chromosome partitioning
MNLPALRQGIGAGLAPRRAYAGHMADAPARHVIAVGSGKGGVGKSTISLNLALAFRAMGQQVGVLDADLHGPNIPLMVGITRHKWTEYWTLARSRPVKLRPVERHGLKIVSAGFILGEDQPLSVEGLTAQTLVRQLFQDVAWGDLDVLVVDLPPGTADVQQQLLKSARFSGAVVVVTPQYVAHLDARKAVRMYQKAGLRVLGAVENMAGIVCPHCGERVDVFPPVPDQRSIWSMGVERLGSVPLDPDVAAAGDTGRALALLEPGSPQARRFDEMARRLMTLLERVPD